MKIPGLRSAYDKVGGLVFFGRLLDKIRLKAAGKLPEGWQTGPNVGFDGRCVRFLQISYDALAERVSRGGTDDEILEWCFRTGRRPNNEEIQIWNAFMMKRGWRDDASEALEQAKREAGLAGRTDLLTYFDFQDADEGRYAKS